MGHLNSYGLTKVRFLGKLSNLSKERFLASRIFCLQKVVLKFSANVIIWPTVWTLYDQTLRLISQTDKKFDPRVVTSDVILDISTLVH